MDFQIRENVCYRSFFRSKIEDFHPKKPLNVSFNYFNYFNYFARLVEFVNQQVTNFKTSFYNV